MLFDYYIRQKLNLSKCIGWKHHRSGWDYCINSLMPLHNDQGILVIDSIERVISKKINLKEPWVGFSHNAIYHNEYIKKTYGHYGQFDLEYIVKSKLWIDNLKLCHGIFSLSSQTYDFLKNIVLTDVVYHTSEIPLVKFKMDDFIEKEDRKIILIGHWMRDFQSFFKLNSPYKKFILKDCENFFNYDKNIILENNSVSFLNRVNNLEYDKLLSSNIVFLKLFDCTACNTVLECITRNTPILVNRLPALEEYLGKDYPFFYESIEQANLMLNDLNLLLAAHEHLKSISKISPKTFLDSVYNSRVYKNI